jgi:hypothetical protein
MKIVISDWHPKRVLLFRIGSLEEARRKSEFKGYNGRKAGFFKWPTLIVVCSPENQFN